MEWWPRRCRLTVALLLILLAVAHRDVLAEPAASWAACTRTRTVSVVLVVQAEMTSSSPKQAHMLVKHTKKTHLPILSCYPPRVLSYMGNLASVSMVVACSILIEKKNGF
jgi:hypothetical protein